MTQKQFERASLINSEMDNILEYKETLEKLLDRVKFNTERKCQPYSIRSSTEPIVIIPNKAVKLAVKQTLKRLRKRFNKLQSKLEEL